MVFEIIIGIIIALLMWWAYHNYKKRNERNLDARGYLRDGYGRLVHRRVAYKHLYNRWKYPERFKSYDIHHKDGNKQNNSPDNLKILTREEHNQKHGIF